MLCQDKEARGVFRADADAVIRHLKATHTSDHGRHPGTLGRHTEGYKDQRVGQEVSQRVLERCWISAEHHFVLQDGDLGIPSPDLSPQLAQTAGDVAVQPPLPPPDGAVID
jgi:hypothetical protein